MITLTESQLPIARALKASPGVAPAALLSLDGIERDSVYVLLKRMKTKKLTEQAANKLWYLTKLGRRALYTTEAALAGWREFVFRDTR